jgi:hypothetical protein
MSRGALMVRCVDGKAELTCQHSPRQRSSQRVEGRSRELTVRQLWIHAPFNHAEPILPLFRSRRWQVENLVDALHRAYPLVQETIELAWAQGTQVFEPFQGAKIGPFTVLSPTRQMYEGLLPQFRDTPPPDQQLLQSRGHWLQGIGRRTSRAIYRIVPEDWVTEALREGGITAAENESSVVLYGDLGAGGMLLTGDVGLRAPATAASYAEANGLPLGDALFSIPGAPSWQSEQHLAFHAEPHHRSTRSEWHSAEGALRRLRRSGGQDPSAAGRRQRTDTSRS